MLAAAMELAGVGSLAFLGPELALGATALVVWLLVRGGRADRSACEVGILGAAFSVLLAARLDGWGEVWLCERLLVVDGLALFAKIVVALAVVGALWITADSAPAGGIRGGAPYLLVAGLALEIMSSAASAWTAYGSVELACLAVGALGRPPMPSRAASAVAITGSLAIGASLAWLSGFGGSTDYEAMRSGLLEVAPRHSIAVATAGSVLLAGVCARVGVVAVRGRASPQSGLLVGVAFTTAGLALVIRWFFGALSQPGELGGWIAPTGLDWSAPLAVAATGAMAAGGLASLRARALSPLLMGSSIANGGYALLGAAVASRDGIRAALFYAGVSAVATIGAFYVASIVSRSAVDGDEVGVYRGLLRGRITTCGAALAIFLLSLGGAPLLAGFPGRIHVLAAVLARQHHALVAVGLGSVALTFYAYGRVLRLMLAAPRGAQIARLGGAELCLLGLLGSLAVALGLHPEPLLRFVSRSATLLPL